MIVLDTHVWIWWVSDPDELSSKARRLVDRAMEDDAIHISCISAWEVAMLVTRNRLKLTMPVANWIETSEALRFVNFVPVTNSIALRAVSLPAPFHNDPADRIIVSTAMTLGAMLITKDDHILRYAHVTTAW